MLKLWDVETQSELTTLQNSAGIRPIAFSHNGRLLAAGLHDGTINVWNVQDEEVFRRLKGQQDVFSLRFSRDDSVIAAASGEKKIWLWKLSAAENRNTAELIGRWAKSQESSEQ